eukprot:1304741-Alexandrium_andersonii.AAC.1
MAPSTLATWCAAVGPGALRCSPPPFCAAHTAIAQAGIGERRSHAGKQQKEERDQRPMGSGLEGDLE